MSKITDRVLEAVADWRPQQAVSLPLGYYADPYNHGWVDRSGAASQLRCRRPM